MSRIVIRVNVNDIARCYNTDITVITPRYFQLYVNTLYFPGLPLVSGDNVLRTDDSCWAGWAASHSLYRVERGGWGQSVTHITALNITESLTTNQEYYDTMQNNNPRIQELNSRIQRLNEESNRRIEEVKLLDIL